MSNFEQPIDARADTPFEIAQKLLALVQHIMATKAYFEGIDEAQNIYIQLVNLIYDMRLQVNGQTARAEILEIMDETEKYFHARKLDQANEEQGIADHLFLVVTKS